MKKFEILWELTKYAIDTKWANAVGKNGVDRLAQCRVGTNPQFLNVIFMKYSKARHSKTGILVYLYCYFM